MKFTTHTQNDHAVSPVVGVMLMLVVTIIIAAVVSSFAGGLTSGQKKIPQVSMQVTYSMTDGMVIRHMGGDPLGTSDMVFTIWEGKTFDANAEEITRQALNLSAITDSDEMPIKDVNGNYNISAFRAGDTLYMSADDTTCDVLQPAIANQITKDGGSISGKTCSGSDKYCKYCIRFVDNKGGSIGKQFTLMISDKSGNMIGKTDVTVTA